VGALHTGGVGVDPPFLTRSQVAKPYGVDLQGVRWSDLAIKDRLRAVV
jgi:hypothetical protein